MKGNLLFKQTHFYIGFMFAILIAGCQTNPQQEQYDVYDKPIHDSLVATGKHGYFTSSYIIGRLKTTQIENSSLPFKIKMISIDPNLLEKNLGFRLLDSVSYQVEYEVNGKSELIKAFFDKELKTKNMTVLTSKSATINNGSIAILKTIDYLFKVHTY